MSALLQFNDWMTQGARIRKWIVGEGLRFGAAAVLKGNRVVIERRDTPADLDLFGNVLPQALGVGRIVPAIMLGEQRRPNVKPVLQLMQPDGRVLAYAKVGWNDLTRGLVENEARALRRWETRPPTSFAIPRLIDRLQWNGLTILLVSPIEHRVFRGGRRGAPPPTSVLRELAGHGGMAEHPLAASPYIAGLRARMLEDADDRITGALDIALRRVVEQDGGRTMTFGTAHGDWAPWNMSRIGSTLHVWDWERMRDDVPVGFDAIHFRFQTAALKSRAAVETVAAQSLAAAREELVALDVEPELHQALIRLYLLEALHRLDVGRRMGLAVRQELLDGLLDLLSKPGDAV